MHMQIVTTMSINKLSNEDYERLKTFFVSYLDWYIPEDHKSKYPDDQPLIFLARLEKTSLANAKKGLQMAVNDTVEATASWTPEEVAAADAKFAAAGTFTLSEIRRHYSKKYLQILKRGVIRSETEYYLLKGIRDAGGIETDATEGQQIEALMAAFEAR
jgi:hypothetical protein